jgi:chromosome segregation ATPase
VKTFEEDWKGAALVQEDPEEPETWSGDMEGQRSQGKGVVEMLEHIKEETVKEMHSAIDDERSAQAGFEATMAALTKQEAELIEGINTYKQALADTETSIEEAHENLASTERDHAAIVAYLAAIEPDCTFYITNYETRKQSRESEKAALEVGVEKLEASPVFKNAVAAQEREDLGKCIPLCDKFGSDHAECLACQEDVSVFGYCSQNGDAKGCAEATATSSAGALK